MIRSRVTGLVSGAFLVVLATACTAQPTAGRPTGDTPPPASSTMVPSTTIAPPPPTPLGTPVPTIAASPAPALPTTMVPAPAHTTAIPECTARTVSLRLGPSDNGMGHQFQELLFTNTGGSSCFVVGFPGVSYVDFHGHQVGQPAVRDGAEGGRIVLAPGQVASSDVSLTDPAVFDPAACRVVQVAGLRVYPPDSFAAMFVSDPRTACSGPIPESQLLVRTIVRGIGGN